jgi:hypothetical protein
MKVLMIMASVTVVSLVFMISLKAKMSMVSTMALKTVT